MMANRSDRELGQPSECPRRYSLISSVGPSSRTPSGPAVFFTTASTGRTEVCTRPNANILHFALATREPSTEAIRQSPNRGLLFGDIGSVVGPFATDRLVGYGVRTKQRKDIGHCPVLCIQQRTFAFPATRVLRSRQGSIRDRPPGRSVCGSDRENHTQMAYASLTIPLFRYGTARLPASLTLQCVATAASGAPGRAPVLSKMWRRCTRAVE